MPRIIVEVRHCDKSESLVTVTENVFGSDGATSLGDWPKNMWLQLASKVYNAYGGSDKVKWVRVRKPGKAKGGRMFWRGEIERYVQYRRARDLLTPDELALVRRFEEMRDATIARWRFGGDV